MRYTLAVAAAALASPAFAGTLHGHQNAHHQHHAREAEAAAEADPEPTVYTFSDGQCFGPGNGCWSKTGDAGAAQTSAPAATTPPAAGVQNIAAQATSVLAQPASQIENAASKATSAIGSVASSVSSGAQVDVESILSKVGMKNAVSDDTCEEGTGLGNVMEITNESDEPFIWTCWHGMGGFTVNVSPPSMAVPIACGDTKTVSFQDTPAGQTGGACAPVFADTVLAQSGGVSNTWLETTFNEYGTSDVSREYSITGHSITAKLPSGCTTSMSSCVFKCTSPTGENGSGSCLNDYELKNCSGTGANNAGKNGGCMVGSGKMTVSVGNKVNSY